MTKKNKFVEYAEQLPEAPLSELGSGGMFHLIVYHDNWCEQLKGGVCNCKPELRMTKEPQRQ